MSRNIIALIIVALASCVSDNSNSSIAALCGNPPDAPARAVHYTTDSSGSPIVTMPAEQYDALAAWIQAESDWRSCALSTEGK